MMISADRASAANIYDVFRLVVFSLMHSSELIWCHQFMFAMREDMAVR